MRLLLIVLFFMTLQSTVNAEEQPVRLLFPSFKPFTYMENGVPTGIGIDAIKAISKTMRQPITLVLVPNYGRAVKEVKLGNADGFLLASRNNERDEIAVFSHPVTNNNWVWFLKPNSQWDLNSERFRSGAHIGTFLHANTHKWLKRNGYKEVHGSAKTQHLPTLLHNGKLDAVLLAEKVFQHGLENHGLQPSDFRTELAVAKPFGIYISKTYLSAHPNYLQRLNEAIIHFVSSDKP